MSDKVFVGQRAAALETAPALQPVTKVVLLVDDDHAVEAGEDSGRTLEAACPYATQAMANTILAALRGYRYRPLSAQDALLDPAAELGDGITAGGAYSVIAQLDWTFDGLFTADLSAPGPEELDSEYKYVNPTVASISRQLAETRSSITKTAEEIRLEVANEVQGLNARITIEVNQITQEVSDTEAGLNSKIEQTAASLTSKITAADGRVTTLSQTVDGISTRVESAEGDISTLSQTATSLRSSISDVSGNVSTLEQTIDGFTITDSSGTTYISGSSIDTDTLRVNNLFGRYINLNTDSGNTAGTIEVTGASTASYAIELGSKGALRLTSGRGQIFMQAAAGGSIQIGGPDITFEDKFDPVCLIPNQDGIGYLGRSSRKWNAVYAATGTIQTSDREAKHDIVYDLSRYGGLFDRLRPMSYRLNQNESNRTHLGLCSQDVEQALAESGLSSLDFAGFIKSPREDETGEKIEGEYDYALRYTEFIPLLIAQVQELKARVAKLEGSETP